MVMVDFRNSDSDAPKPKISSIDSPTYSAKKKTFLSKKRNGFDFWVNAGVFFFEKAPQIEFNTQLLNNVLLIKSLIFGQTWIKSFDSM